MRRPVHLACLAACLLGGGCTSDGGFNRFVDSLHPWPGFGSSRQVTEAAGPFAPAGSLTRRRVADDADPTMDPLPPAPLRTEPGNVWPAPETRQNTLADFERSMRDGTPPPSPPRGAVP